MDVASWVLPISETRQAYRKRRSAMAAWTGKVRLLLQFTHIQDWSNNFQPRRKIRWKGVCTSSIDLSNHKTPTLTAMNVGWLKSSRKRSTCWRLHCNELSAKTGSRRLCWPTSDFKYLYVRGSVIGKYTRVEAVHCRSMSKSILGSSTVWFDTDDISTTFHHSLINRETVFSF